MKEKTMNCQTLPPLNIAALTELWDFLRVDTMEERRLEILQTEGPAGLATYDTVLRFLNNYILIAEGKMPEESLDIELRRMLPIIRKGIEISERVVVGTTNELLLATLRKLEKIAKTPRLYKHEDKILTFDQLASLWHSGAFNLGGALGTANKSLTFVAQTVFRALANSKEQILEEQRQSLNRLKELRISTVAGQWKWRTENCKPQNA